jgi:hypothetical protein
VPLILAARLYYHYHPNHDAISMYARSGSLILGRLIVTGVKLDDTEKKRKEQYDYYLTRGLKIPSNLLPKEQNNMVQGKDDDRTDANSFPMERSPFRPSIVVNRDTRSSDEGNSKR